MALWFDGCPITYGALVADAERIATALIAAGIKPGSRIAIMARPTLDYGRVLIGILLARCAVVPLSTSLPSAALESLLADAAAALVFVDHDNEAQLDAVGHGGQCIGIGEAQCRAPMLPDWLTKIADTPNALAEQQDADLFSIIYSSGTTGMPKGIAHNVRARSEFFALGASGGDSRTLLTTALFTNASFCTLLGTLFLGGTCLVQERFEPRSFIEVVEQQQVNRCFLVPVQFKRILADAQFSPERLRSLVSTTMSGSQCATALKVDLAAVWPGDLIETYGLSEGGVLTCLNLTRSPEKLASVGTLLPGYEMLIVGEDDKPVPPRTEGEILGCSPYVMNGYFNRDDLTESFTWRDATGRAFQRTGDIGWLDDDGYLHISDRKKDVIISGGLNIYAAEIDQLFEQHPDVQEAAVVAAPSERWGETPAAFIVLRPGAPRDATTLLDWVNARVARQMRVSAIQFTDALPRNPMGKVMKRELRDSLR